MTKSADAEHTCWDTDNWDGTLQDDCLGCDLAIEFPCVWCGYGHIFTTHNPVAHAENEDSGMLLEEEWTDDMFVLPYRDWRKYQQRHSQT